VLLSLSGMSETPAVAGNALPSLCDMAGDPEHPKLAVVEAFNAHSDTIAQAHRCMAACCQSMSHDEKKSACMCKHAE